MIASRPLPSPTPSRPRLLVGGMLAAALVLALATPASATWSIVAVDEETEAVGVAIASCVPLEVLGDPTVPLVPLVVLPGEGAAVSQAQLNIDAPPRIRELVAADTEASVIIEDLIDPERDELAEVRQHAVVLLGGEVAAFTGAETLDASLDRQGAGVSVQGNLLVSDEVIVDALAAFEDASADGQSLEVALADALVAGAEAGGDRRCEDQTALFAQVVVAGPDDDPTEPRVLVTVAVDEGDDQNPVTLLAQRLADGQLGFHDLGQADEGGGGLVRIGVAVAAVLMVVGGIVAFSRGMGSISARRSTRSDP